MTIEDQVKDEKLQYDINREAAKISALSSGKLDKYEYLTGEEILPSIQQQIIQQAKFNYSPIGKALEKQRKTIEDQGEKRVVALESLKDSDKKLTPIKDFLPTEYLNPEIINEIKRIEEIEKKVGTNRMVFKGTNIIKLMILEILKQYVLLVMKLEIILLVWIQQILNKRIY